MKYIGTKIINAQPMTRESVEMLLKRSIGGNNHGDGYLVTYEDGYQSWSPKEVFDSAYRPVTAMTFGDALVMLKAGKRVCRAGWNGKGMWLALVGTGECVVSRSVTDFSSCGSVYEIAEWIGMKTTDEKFVPWLASQTDVLASDWEAVE